VGEKRGAHLALSLERLRALTGSDPVRIGLSATQKPIETVAGFLAAGEPCTIIDSGHRRRMDIQVELPASPLTAVMANEVWDEVYQRIEQLIGEHRTTLVFVNTRRLAERVAHRLGETLGEDKVAAHHGSLSRERRFAAEQRLKHGQLRALVATASLELGIDIGSVDLVIQIACPRSISAFLQRVGRAGHAVGATPKGRLFPLTRDELIESAALLDAVRRGELDTLSVPPKPLDILSQQIVAETACREWSGTELYALFRRAWPYRDLARSEFDEIAVMLSEGFTTRRGRRGAHLHHDGINDRLRGRQGARLTALTNGGAIPDTFDYEVRLEPGNVILGTVNEDFAIDSTPGDIFMLGNNSWQIIRLEGMVMRVADAHGQPPTIPFWLGEAPGRSEAFSLAVSRVREEVSDRLGGIAALQAAVEAQGSGPGAPWKRSALDWLGGEVGLGEAGAEQLIDYLASAKLALGVMPSVTTLVL
jgi:ATP-dependent Lhr-like helicase